MIIQQDRLPTSHNINLIGLTTVCLYLYLFNHVWAIFVLLPGNWDRILIFHIIYLIVRLESHYLGKCLLLTVFTICNFLWCEGTPMLHI